MNTAQAQDNVGAYSPLPRGLPDRRTQPEIALGAGLAVLAAAFALPLHKFQRPAPMAPAVQAPARSTPSAAPEGVISRLEAVDSTGLIVSPNAPSVSVQPVPAMAAFDAAPAKIESLAGGDAWARTSPAQRWMWPAHLKKGAPSVSQKWRAFVGQGVHQTPSPGGDAKGFIQRIAEWTPANPDSKQILLARETAKGTEMVYYEKHPPVPKGLAEIRARELEALRMSRRAAGARDITQAGKPPQAELTYADGRKEVIAYDPLVFDLTGEGVKVDTRHALYDLAGAGRMDRIEPMNDMDPGTGILVFDPDGSGVSGKNGTALFGDRTALDNSGTANGFIDGFEALRGLVEKAAREGVLPADALARGILDAGALAALERAYGLKMKVGGLNHKAVSLAQAGVQAIALSQAAPDRVDDFDGQGNSLSLQQGALFLRRDGTTGYYMDVWLKVR